MRFLAIHLALLCLLVAPAPTRGDDAATQRRPRRFAIIFNKGYAGDHLPREPEQFEKLIKALREMHFNTVLCPYSASRAEICKKYDVQIFVDLLAEPHVYRTVEECKKLCTSLRNNPVIYGYHLWSDNIGSTGAGRTRDVKNVHAWDGTHPAYIGSYRLSKVSSVQGMDLFGYYDFHWTRGGHWGNLSRALAVTKDRKIPFLRYDSAAPGIEGKGNSNRAGYTIATSIPFGLKGYTYHYAGGMVKPGTWELDALGKDVQKVNAKFASVGAELMTLSDPTAIYSTPVTIDAKNRPLNAAAVPGGLTAIPEKSWFQVSAGEVLVGLCQDPARRAVLVLAAHNPYQEQKVKLQFAEGVRKVEFFERSRSRWRELPIQERQVDFTVEDYAAELVRITKE